MVAKPRASLQRMRSVGAEIDHIANLEPSPNPMLPLTDEPPCPIGLDVSKEAPEQEEIAGFDALVG